MALTRTLWGAHSRARNCVNWLTPPLVMLYVNTFDSGGPEEAEEMLMMEPPRPPSTMLLPNT